MNISLRPVVSGDTNFLAALYASTREEELQQTGWPLEARAAFLRQQFEAQQAFYTREFSDAGFSIVLSDGNPVGRLYLDRRDDVIRIVDVSMLPDFQGVGIGSRLLAEVLAEARAKGLPVRLHVERHNRARRLYERLGFTRTGENGLYLSMEWKSVAGTW